MGSGGAFVSETHCPSRPRPGSSCRRREPRQVGEHIEVDAHKRRGGYDAISTRVDGFTTVCAYNRAGLGASDPRPLPHGAQAAAHDLHSLLAASGLGPPYVLVGASYGGLDVQLFARHHPAETAGVVLVDALAPGWDDRLEAILTP